MLQIDVLFSHKGLRFTVHGSNCFYDITPSCKSKSQGARQGSGVESQESRVKAAWDGKVVYPKIKIPSLTSNEPAILLYHLFLLSLD